MNERLLLREWRVQRRRVLQTDLSFLGNPDWATLRRSGHPESSSCFRPPAYRAVPAVCPQILRGLTAKYKDRPFSYLWAEGGAQPGLEANFGVGGAPAGLPACLPACLPCCAAGLLELHACVLVVLCACATRVLGDAAAASCLPPPGCVGCVASLATSSHLRDAPSLPPSWMPGYGYPALIAFNPGKAKYANLKSAFEDKPVKAFIESVRLGFERVATVSGPLATVEARAPWDGSDGEEVAADEFDLADLMGDDEEEGREEL